MTGWAQDAAERQEEEAERLREQVSISCEEYRLLTQERDEARAEVERLTKERQAFVDEAFRLGQERDAARNALAMIEGADLGEIDGKLIARQARALHSRAPAAPPDEIAHGLRGHMCSVCRGVIPHGEVAAFADGGRGPARHLGCAPSALPGEGGAT